MSDLQVAVTARIAKRLLGLAVYIIVGMLLASILAVIRLVLPRASLKLRSRLTRWWLRQLGRVLGMRVFSYGDAVREPVLYVANHISWIDIIALAGIVPADFIAKQEVRGWPLIGWLAEVGGTLFVRRGDFAATRGMEQQMVARLTLSRSLILFPEGTTTLGDIPKPFRPRLYQAAIRAGVPVQPVAISYRGSPAVRNRIAFLGQQGLLENLWMLLGMQSIPVTLRLMPPLSSKEAKARSLANASWEAVLAGLEAAFERDSSAAA